MKQKYPKLLGVCIHHGFSPESRVFAGLLKHRDNGYEPLVIYNCWKGHDQGIDKFRNMSQAEVIGIDTGWRPNDGSRSPFDRMHSVVNILRSWSKMLKIANEFHPDVIYSCQQTWDNLTATYLSRKLSLPQIIHLHYLTGLGGSWIGKFAEKQLKECNHVITVSDFVREQAIGYGVTPDRVTTVHNTIEVSQSYDESNRKKIREELSIPRDALVLGITARLEPWKGQSDTIRAFGRIANEFPNAFLIIVGNGIILPDLQKQAKDTGYTERIIFTGFRTDVPKILAALDVFVHPSRLEPAGLAIMEACASGLPVIAYEEGGVCEYVVNGKTGLLTRPNDISLLADSMKTLLSNPYLRKKMGEAGRSRMESYFKPEDSGTKFKDLISSILYKYIM